MAAAVCLAKGPRPQIDTTTVALRMQQSGAPQVVIDAHIAALKPEVLSAGVVELWPDHELPVQGYMACASQWRVTASMAGVVYHGLDYTACDVSLRRHGIELDKQAWRDFRDLESYAAFLLNGGKAEDMQGDSLQ
jgi:Phage related hypothetical protein (DUF1799)